MQGTQVRSLVQELRPHVFTGRLSPRATTRKSSRCHKDLHAATKTQCSQINTYLKKKTTDYAHLLPSLLTWAPSQPPDVFWSFCNCLRSSFHKRPRNSQRVLIASPTRPGAPPGQDTSLQSVQALLRTESMPPQLSPFGRSITLL